MKGRLHVVLSMVEGVAFRCLRVSELAGNCLEDKLRNDSHLIAGTRRQGSEPYGAWHFWDYVLRACGATVAREHFGIVLVPAGVPAMMQSELPAPLSNSRKTRAPLTTIKLALRRLLG